MKYETVVKYEKTCCEVRENIREVGNTFWREVAKQGFQFIFFLSEKAFIVIRLGPTTIHCVQFSEYMVSTQG